VSRKKLEEMGLDLPLLPVTAVGSFPKPPFLIEAGERAAAGNLSRAKLAEAEREATEFWIKTQEEAGMDVLVDGEQYRGDLVSFFADRMKGFEPGGLVRCFGNRYYRKPVITGEVRWRRPMTVKWWNYAQDLASRPVKGVVTGPYTLMDFSFNEHYPSRRAAALAIAREMRREVAALIGAGCRIVQIDEPALSARPGEMGLAADAIEALIENLSAYFIVHACYGSFESVCPGALKLPVHNFDLEMTNGGFRLLEAVASSTRDFSLGVVDVHSPKVDSPEAIERRIKRALRAVDSEQLWIDPDCGLRTRTLDQATAQLKAMRDAVASVRKGL